MFIEIEETVCFIASFLYGKIPRSRIDSFAETMANGLVDRVYIRSEPLKSYSLVVNVDDNKDNLIEEAAACAFISLSELGKLLPANLLLELRDGSVHAVNADTGHVKCIYPAQGCSTVNRRNGRRIITRPIDVRRRPCFRVEFAYPKGSERDERAVAKPNFESSQGGESGYGHHPFTMPSIYAYLRLLAFLNAIACATSMTMQKNDGNVNVKTPQKTTDEFSDDEKKRLSEDVQGDRSSSGFVDDDELSDPVNEKSEVC
ncbi:BTG family protein [Dictyocaulus viviparus]|uniref:BTG family protein n=1 Tax=Dictyocaulus viviparus TaxID=29172 RepID=A0A0D8Y7Y2_DICVI|nr:BTG family protein [Dictyocaulus viviparus]